MADSQAEFVAAQRRVGNLQLGVSVSRTELVAVHIHHEGDVRQFREPIRGNRIAEALEGLFSRIGSELDELAAPISSVTFDVSEALDHDDPPTLVAVRLVPRPPIDRWNSSEQDWAELGHPRIVYAGGGHTALGEELAPLDIDALTSLTETADRSVRYVVTSVGSLIHPAHEIAAERLLSGHLHTLAVEGSHVFHSSSFAVRERTALANQALLPQAESLGTALALVSGQVFAKARLYVATSDGGKAPLSRLAVAPVHSLLSGHAVELVGAAALCDTHEGQLIIAHAESLYTGEMLNGVPAVIPYAPISPVGRLATQTANIRPVNPQALASRMQGPAWSHSPPTLVLQAGATLPDMLQSLPRRSTAIHLRALGAACAFHTEWVNRFIRIANAEDMQAKLAEGETRVRARLVAAGASPSQTRIVESRLAATAYETPNVVAVRVRGAAGARPALQDLVVDS